MIDYKQKIDKRERSFILVSLFALFLILSFISISGAYGADNEISITNDIDINAMDDSLDGDLNQNKLILEDDLDSYNGPFENTSNENNSSEESNTTLNVNKSINSSSALNGDSSYHGNTVIIINSPSSTNSTSDKQSEDMDDFNSNYFNENYNIKDNYKTNNPNYLIDNSDNLDKISLKSPNLDNIDLNSIYLNQYYNLNFNNYDGYYNDINEYINNNVIIILNSNSNSNFNGNGFDNPNNLLKEVANFNFAKVNDADDASTIGDLQSSYEPNLTILLFIKIFMEHHDNGKEHLNSF